MNPIVLLIISGTVNLASLLGAWYCAQRIRELKQERDDANKALSVRNENADKWLNLMSHTAEKHMLKIERDYFIGADVADKTNSEAK